MKSLYSHFEIYYVRLLSRKTFSIQVCSNLTRSSAGKDTATIIEVETTAITTTTTTTTTTNSINDPSKK